MFRFVQKRPVHAGFALEIALNFASQSVRGHARVLATGIVAHRTDEKAAES
jgi:hypothetical protein